MSSTAARAARAGAGRVVSTDDVERLLESLRLQDIADRMFRSQTADDLIGAFLRGPLFERFVDGLLDSQALWALVDRVAGSPSVTAAVSQQGLGFAEQLGAQLRSRSRWGDDLIEQVVSRLLGRGPGDAPTQP